jgi:hypothetical protein
MMESKRGVIWLGIAAALLVLAGCATPIARIEANPRDYAGQTVRVQGIVVDAFNVPGVDLSFYSLSDGTARMPVVAHEDRVEGESVRVEVRVVAIAGKAAAREAADAVDELADVLVERDIVSRARARNVARRVITAIRNVGRGISGSYLLVETN